MHTHTVTDPISKLTISGGKATFSVNGPFSFHDPVNGNGWIAFWKDGYAQVYRLKGGVQTEELARALCGKNASWDIRFMDGKAVIEVH